MSLPIPAKPDALLPRDQAASALTALGYITSKATLATLATRGGGPVFVKYGPRPLYRLADLLAWAQSRLTPPRRSTSEADAAAALLSGPRHSVSNRSAAVNSLGPAKIEPPRRRGRQRKNHHAAVAS